MFRFFSNLSIRKKLFAAISLILVINFLLLVLLGSTLFEAFYESNKVHELKKTAELVRSSYQENTTQSWQELFDQILTVENRNSVVVIFELEAQKSNAPKILYHSRMRSTEQVEVFYTTPGNPASKSEQSPSAPPDSLAPTPPPDDGVPAASVTPAEIISSFTFQPLGPFFESELLAQLPTLAINGVVTNLDIAHPHADHGKISIVSRLDDQLYLMLDSPREYLAATASLAVRYSAVVSIGVLFVGALVVYYLAGRFTRPISQMEQVAKQIAQLNFSSSCAVRSGDELGTLAASINDMSAELQSNMNRLVDANRVLQEDLERQQQTERLRRQFISDVSHDFKTPLTLMVSYAETIRDMPLPDPQRLDEFCGVIVDEGNRLSAMVGRLLRLSRLESGMDALELSVFSLNQLLDDAARYQKLLAEQKHLTVTKHYCGETIVEADYQKLTQVVANLTENAVKYTPDGGSIALSTRLTGEALCEISVENTGSHIPPEELENIFISFYRSDRSRERSGHSYGLGLAIVNSILALHGQQCLAQNTESGVVFRFCLPTVELS
ncbi:MAG: ATP-binding protein [Angelakisella sp.]